MRCLGSGQTISFLVQEDPVFFQLSAITMAGCHRHSRHAFVGAPAVGSYVE